MGMGGWVEREAEVTEVKGHDSLCAMNNCIDTHCTHFTFTNIRKSSLYSRFFSLYVDL